jgi:2-polyprenyl-3-methyl-5-hydroxy-6-metoxy-1,4-benzoquinol methylase
MTVETFFSHFEEELKNNQGLTDYHRIINSDKLYHFRRAYLEQRLNYVLDNVEKPGAKIWDVGCGFGTTSFLLALNGYEVKATTLEYYYEEIQERIRYWSQFGDLSKLRFEYENIFDEEPEYSHYDYIVAQDTLHHLEPFREAVKIFHKALKPTGRIIVSEENGNNIICNIKHFRERGFKRVKTIYDERLEKDILIGDENTRGLKKWRKEFSIMPFEFDENSIEYIRYYFPGKYTGENTRDIIAKEQKLWKRSPIKRELMFFGMNFIIDKV